MKLFEIRLVRSIKATDIDPLLIDFDEARDVPYIKALSPCQRINIINFFV